MAQELFSQLERQHGLPSGLLDAVWAKESARGKQMRSPVGAMGHFQFMPATAKEYGLTNPDDLTQSAGAAAKMYGNLLKQYGGDLPKALAAYNWGSGNLERKGLDRAPAETRDYIATISSKVQPKGPTMAGRDFSAELFGDAPKAPTAGRDFSAELFADEPPKRNPVLQQGANLLGGAVRGAGSLGATVMRALPNFLGGDTAEENEQRRRDMDAALQNLIGADPDSLAYQGGKLGAEIAGTAPIGGLLGRGVGAAANMAGRGAQAAPLVQALTTSGFNAGGATGGAGLALRALGGGATGAATAAAVNPEDAGSGAMIGAALPGVLQGIGKVGGAAGRVVRDMRTPADTKAANKLAQALDMQPGDLLRAIGQQGPQALPGYQATVPQILQNPVTSQLQRTLKAAGANAIGDAERVQQQVFRDALEGVAPIANTVQDAAERAGGAIGDFGRAERAKVGKAVSAEFNAIDPFNESQILLPVDDFRAAAAKYLGEGTFGTGGKVAQALGKAQEVGTTEIPAIVATTKKAIGNSQNLEQAVRAAGGIKPGAGGLGGEIGDLMNRQSGTSGLVNAKSGKSVDLLASDLFNRGYLPDDDPATLLEMLRGGAGRKVYASDITDDAFRGRMESAMGDLPEATRIAKPVNFQTMQNLRSSMGEAAEQASLAGNKKEAAALRQMVSDIDGKLQNIADGVADPAEMFAPDMVQQYKTALKAHAEKMKRFETGPQAGMFRKAGDGQMQVQGAEIPGKFFSGKRSQVEDMQAFKRLIGDRQDLAAEMKRFAVTEGASTSNTAGDLTAKYLTWLDSRSGGLRELLSPQELATLREVGKGVERQINAEQLGRVTGLDTAQKLASMQSLGALDSKVVDILANRIPLVGQFTGPMLSGLRKTAAQTQNDALSRLLANPDALSQALKVGVPENMELLRLLSGAGQGALKVAPVISAQ
jgi:hypothetical protein